MDENTIVVSLTAIGVFVILKILETIIIYLRTGTFPLRERIIERVAEIQEARLTTPEIERCLDKPVETDDLPCGETQTSK